MNSNINTRQLERKILYTECIHCDSPIDKGLYDELDNTMYLDCNSCKEDSTVWDWYDDEGSHSD